MARQIAQVPVTGTLGDITFYKTTESGFLARMKTDLDAERLRTDPKFAESRKAYADFGRAGAGAGLLRKTMIMAGYQLSDTRIISRLTGTLRGIISTDKVHAKGEMQLDDAELERLAGFEWNKHRPFGSLCRFSPAYRIDAATGLMEVDLPELDTRSFDVPEGASHYELIMEGAGVNFREKKGERVVDSTGWVELGGIAPAARTLNGTLSVTTWPKMLLGLGVRFGQEVNGQAYPLEDKSGMAFVTGLIG
jgi:hypothetical protein